MKIIDIKKYFCYLIMLLILLTNKSFAVEVQFNQGANQSESQNLLTNSIVQYKQGQILLGTDTGLFLHNGYNLKPFLLNSKTEDKIEIYSITNLYVDKKQVLWIGTNGEGLYRYDESKRQLDIFSKSNNQIDSDNITALVADKKGGMWIATDFGLNYISQSLKARLISFKHIDKLYITSMIRFDQDTLLIGSLSGLFFFDTIKNTLTELKLDVLKQEASIFALHKDSNNKIWIGTQNGIFYYNNNKYTSFKPEKLSSKVTSITSTKNDIWVATVFDGLFKISKNTEAIDNFIHSTKKHSISENSITHLFSDNNNGLWISFFTNGINYLNTNNFVFGF